MLVASPLVAEIKMPRIFSDNMLLQRDMFVKVWGEADANAQVDVAFGGQKKSTKADASGNWSLKLDKMSANKNPQEMTVSENGKIGKVIKNVLVGEVWIAGGQSNMEWRLYQSSDGKAAMARAKYPHLRCFQQRRAITKYPQKDSQPDATWLVADGKNFSMVTAVGFYFAERLMQDLDVPVAIISASRGASKMSCWIPREYHSKCESYKNYLAEFEKVEAGYCEAVYKKRAAEHKQLLEDVANKKRKPLKNWWLAKIPPNPISPWHDFHSPSYLYNAMLAPIAGYGLRGAIWYQGESDTYPEEIDAFAEKLVVLVDAWREKFENPDLSFIQVQLAPYTIGNRDWALGRWQQLKACDMTKNLGVINIIDCGEEREIHPVDKTTVGNRLALLAMKDVYKKDVNAYAPKFKSAKYSKDSAEILFDSFGRKLETKGDARGFEVCVNGKWEKGVVSFNNGKVVVKSANGAEISGVRYLWKNWARPDAWLFNQDGLPAFSFIDKK